MIKLSTVESIINSTLSVNEKQNQLATLNIDTKVAEKAVYAWQHAIEIKRLKLQQNLHGIVSRARDYSKQVSDYARVWFASAEEKAVLSSLIAAGNRVATTQVARQMHLQYAKEFFIRKHMNFAGDAKTLLKNERPVSELGQFGFASFGKYLVTCKESVSYDNKKYSKSWHRAHGGAKSVDSRDVVFFNTLTDEITKVAVDAWRGEYVAQAIAQFLKLQPVKVAKQLRKIQLNEAFDIVKVREIAGAQVWQRTIGGYHWDYCVVSGNETFHASTVKAAIEGLRKKREARVEADSETINYQTAKAAGFCRTGIAQFCNDNDLDIDGEYTRAELRKIVVSNRDLNCQKYQQDLRKIGISLNCK